jgi:excisionase family DNA binding protein
MSVVKLPGVFTVTEAAEKANVSTWTIREQIRLSHLRAREIGRCKRILSDELDRWLHDYEGQS